MWQCETKTSVYKNQIILCGIEGLNAQEDFWVSQTDALLYDIMNYVSRKTNSERKTNKFTFKTVGVFPPPLLLVLIYSENKIVESYSKILKP